MVPTTTQATVPTPAQSTLQMATLQLETPRLGSLEDYLALDASLLPEGRYEVVDGVIVAMGAEADQNLEIAGFLLSVFLQFVPHYLLRRGTEIEVPSDLVTTRCPDLMVLAEQTRRSMPQDKRSLITQEMPPPALVVEVVSPGDPGTPNYDRDYVSKPLEYAALGIPEYWIVDPHRQSLLVLYLVNGSYETRVFQGSEAIASPTFPALNLTVDQMMGCWSS